jgi:DNA-nicking Smr family endonuclease
VPKRRRLEHRPFESLETAKPTPKSNARASSAAAKPTPSAPSELSFYEAAAALGTKPLRGERGRVRPPRPPASTRSGAVPEFVVDGDELTVAGYRQELGVRVLARLQATPSATLDLHRTTTAVARVRLATFLAAQASKGAVLVLVIVGKGRHSPGGEGVLRGAIAELLTAGAAGRSVLAFRSAPRALGGSGAVLVLVDARRA